MEGNQENAARRHAIEARGRHPSTQQVTRWFDYDHLPDGKPREVSELCTGLAANMLYEVTGDSPELTAGLRKLLEAKDCFVRAAIAAGDPK